ncbi:phosphatase PAP2 family protein [Aurantiacibacter odishensis]|uniref:phosphatase PAP2 family protein n=1 Tax=Aurantiacibacter odishensis TaxID=1155476 RepID=UPI0013C4FB15|nr:phosphatase PAP2 family protein [Aurantiacibacter odishensis]
MAMIFASFVALKSVGVDLAPGSYVLNLQIVALSVAMILGPHCLLVLWRERPPSPIRYCAQVIKENKATALRALPLLLAVALFMPTFSAMKSAIPLFNEFAWDSEFIAWDAAIHGTDPWRLLQPVLGFPVATALLALAYHVWVLLIYPGSVYFAVYVRDDRLVLRYFTAFFLIWFLLGIALATWLASVGPVFLEPILGDPRFLEQTGYLVRANEVVPIMVLPVQEQLLAGYEAGLHGLGRGITAMPSMHVALAFLFWIAARQINQTFGRVMLGFMLIVLIGSVHLAYHYAVDGYVSVVLTLIVWKASALLTADRQPMKFPRRHARGGFGNDSDEYEEPGKLTE